MLEEEAKNTNIFSDSILDLKIQDGNSQDITLSEAPDMVIDFFKKILEKYRETLSFDRLAIGEEAYRLRKKLEQKDLPSVMLQAPVVQILKQKIPLSNIVALVKLRSAELYQGFKADLRRRCQKYVLKKIVGPEIRTKPHDKKSSQLREDFDSRDTFCSWGFDPFFGAMTIELFYVEDVTARAVLRESQVNYYEKESTTDVKETDGILEYFAKKTSDFPLLWTAEDAPAAANHGEARNKKSGKEKKEDNLDEKLTMIVIFEKAPEEQRGRGLTQNMSLKDFLNYIAEKRQKSEENAKNWLKILYQENFDTVEALAAVDENCWNKLRQKFNAYDGFIIKEEVENYKTIMSSSRVNNNTPACRLGVVHKIRRFFAYNVGEVAELSDLEAFTVETAFQEVEKAYQGKELLDQLKKFFQVFTLKQTENMSVPRGLLLYGPPGTGKTTLTDDLPLRIGLTPICNPISATEVNRSLVGETERLLNELFNRARKMPHLRCCIAIDEIDRLAPKRDDKSGEHKGDSLCMLLSLIGGAKDVPNLFILASTNLLNKIDEAFRRRMSGQYFVGRPNPETREGLLRRMERDIPGVLKAEEYELLRKTTVNFTGAALKALMTSIIVDVLCNPDLQNRRKQLREAIYNSCEIKSKQFNIWVGSYVLAEVLRRNEVARANDFIWPNDLNVERTTGRIIVDRKQGLIEIQLKDKIPISEVGVRPPDIVREKGSRTCELKLLQLNAKQGDRSLITLEHLLPFFGSFVSKNNIDYVQVVDQDTLHQNNAFDDKAIQETIQEKLQEFDKYPRSLMILDLDSLVGISFSQSSSGMGPSASTSVGSARMFSDLVHLMTKSKVERDTQRWIFMMVTNESMKSHLTESIAWPFDFKRMEENIRDELNNQVRVCLRCKDKFTEKDNNNYTSCNFHPTDILLERFENGKLSSLRGLTEELAQDQLNRIKKPENLIYLCCRRPFGSQGCKRDKHCHNHREWQEEHSILSAAYEEKADQLP